MAKPRTITNSMQRGFQTDRAFIGSAELYLSYNSLKYQLMPFNRDIVNVNGFSFHLPMHLLRLSRPVQKVLWRSFKRDRHPHFVAADLNISIYFWIHIDEWNERLTFNNKIAKRFFYPPVSMVCFNEFDTFEWKCWYCTILCDFLHLHLSDIV